MAARSDNFNRADASGLGNPSDGGSAWNAVTGTWDISSNQAISVAIASNLQSLEASVADCDIQLVCANNPLNSGVGARISSAGNASLVVYGTDSGVSGGMGIYRLQAGGYTLLTSDSAGDVVSSDTVKLNVNGTGITAYVNGASRLSTTSTFNQTTTTHGLWSYTDSGSRIDDFSIADLGGATGHPAVKRMGGVQFAHRLGGPAHSLVW